MVNLFNCLILPECTEPNPYFEAERVIFNPPATVVYWKDGTKTVVRCKNDEFSEEFGFAMACVRKLYGNHSKFLAQFKDAQRPYLNKRDKDATTQGDGDKI